MKGEPLSTQLDKDCSYAARTPSPGRASPSDREKPMPLRHRFLEPIHNVKEGANPRSAAEAAKIWSSSLENVCRGRSPPSLFELRRAAFAVQAWGLASRSRAAAKAGGASRDRTDDLKLAKLALSQLSYGPIRDKVHEVHGSHSLQLVGRGGVEPPTSRLSGVRSNHLSYRPRLRRRLRRASPVAQGGLSAIAASAATAESPG